MGGCRYCGKPVGLLRSKHSECKKIHREGRREYIALVQNASASDDLIKHLPERLSQLSSRAFITQADGQDLAAEGWAYAVDDRLQDNILDQEEENRLAMLQDILSLSQQALEKNGAYSRVTKAAVIREVLEGKIPNKIRLDGSLPINLQKSEQVVWAFTNADYLEDKTRREYVGRSSGVSVRVAKGVYYRVGQFRGHPVERTERVHVASGLFIVTNKNLYFHSSVKALRIPYSKIVSFEPYSDGIGIMRDAASAKPQIFTTGDGWFTYNLVTNLAQL